MNFSTPELQELDRIWPLGQQLIVPENGVIFVAGAWKGLYCRYLTERFPTAKIYGFEPQRAACREAANWTAMDKNVSIFPFGIGIENGIVFMGDADTDGCSLLKTSKPITQGLLIESRAIRVWLDIDYVDLAILNMEGSEYALLNHWIDSDEIDHYGSLAIQFHPDIANVHTPPDSLVGDLTNIYGRPHECSDYPTWCYWKK